MSAAMFWSLQAARLPPQRERSADPGARLVPRRACPSLDYQCLVSPFRADSAKSRSPAAAWRGLMGNWAMYLLTNPIRSSGAISASSALLCSRHLRDAPTASNFVNFVGMDQF